MVKYRIKARNVQNVAASSTALIELPVGPRYHYLVLEHGFASGTNTIVGAEANITDIKVKVNGRVQRQFNASELRDLNILNGTAYDCQGLPNTAPGVSFPIFFAEPWRKSPGDQDALAWPTAGWQSLQVEVTLGAASTPTLQVHGVVDDYTPADPTKTAISKVIKQSFAAAGTVFDISSIDPRDWLQQISLYQASGGSVNIDRVDLRVNGRMVHELEDSANTALLLNHGMTPAASGRTSGVYDVVLDHDDLLGSAVNLNGVRDVTLTVTGASSQSGSMVALVQRLGPIE
jgi:hypothetical protein